MDELPTGQPGPSMREQRLEIVARALCIGNLRRHIFLCADQSTPKCSTREESRVVWSHLKRRLEELGLASAPPERSSGGFVEPPAAVAGDGVVLRTKADCLRICEQGPIAVVYPEGTWYRSVTVDVIERIITEHLVAGRPVTEYVFAVDDLSGDS